MKNLLPLVSAALLALPIAAVAGPLEFNSAIPQSGSVSGFLDWDGSADGDFSMVKVSNTAGVPVSFAGSAGQFQGYFSTDPLTENNNPANLFFRFFCIDLYQYAKPAVTAYRASSYSNNQLSKLYDIAYPNAQLGDFYNASSATKSSFGQFSNANGYTRQAYSTAFQLAVWELFYETAGSHSLSSGTFKDAMTSSDAHKIADTWLAQVDAYTGNGTQHWQLYRFDSPDSQDYLAARFVPEPGSMALIGVAMLGLLGLRRRRTQESAD